jgi:predicted metal-binding membrane protein
MTIVGSPLHTTGRDMIAAARQARWRYPEWPLALIAVAAWMAMFAVFAGHVVEHTSHPAGHVHGSLSQAVSTSPAPHPSVLHWTLMVVAMMLPTILPAARSVAFGSRWHRRHRSQALFAMGYLVPWIVLGALTIAVVSRLGFHWPRWLLPAALIVAALWELTGLKVQLLRACHRVRPIPPQGWRTDAACLARGLSHAGWCIGACWALMGAMLVADHLIAVWLMLPMTAAIVVEKFAARPDRVVRPVAAALAAGAALATLI